jgi:uncharacterized protein (TIGR02145 family)
MKVTSLVVVVVLGCAGMAISDSLSGRLLNPDSSGRSGVLVSLAGTGLSSTTGSDGSWSIQRTTNILEAATPATAVARHLVVLDGRLGIVLDGWNASGRASGVAKTIALSPTNSARMQAVTPDTLVYSWNGKVILRDTVQKTATAPMVRYFDTTVSASVTYGYAGDVQQRQYRTVKIGTQVWMAQNLDIKVDSSWCYNDSNANCQRYGRLYKWSTAMALPDTCDTTDCHLIVGNAPRQGLCPAGWHIPTDADWNVLFAIPRDSARVRFSSSTGWFGTGNGTDQYGMALQAAGLMGFNQSPPFFGGVGKNGIYWSATEQYVPLMPEGVIIQRLPSCYFASYNAADMDSSNWSDGVYAVSVRCLRD